MLSRFSPLPRAYDWRDSCPLHSIALGPICLGFISTKGGNDE